VFLEAFVWKHFGGLSARGRSEAYSVENSNGILHVRGAARLWGPLRAFGAFGGLWGPFWTPFWGQMSTRHALPLGSFGCLGGLWGLWGLLGAFLGAILEPDANQVRPGRDPQKGPKGAVPGAWV
jgi:hypothetical protein